MPLNHVKEPRIFSYVFALLKTLVRNVSDVSYKFVCLTYIYDWFYDIDLIYTHNYYPYLTLTSELCEVGILTPKPPLLRGCFLFATKLKMRSTFRYIAASMRVKGNVFLQKLIEMTMNLDT